MSYETRRKELEAALAALPAQKPHQPTIPPLEAQPAFMNGLSGERGQRVRALFDECRELIGTWPDLAAAANAATSEGIERGLAENAYQTAMGPWRTELHRVEAEEAELRRRLNTKCKSCGIATLGSKFCNNDYCEFAYKRQQAAERAARVV